MVFILLFFTVLGVALFAIIYTLDHKPKKQPEHFDLLDENGDPLPSQVKVSIVKNEDVEVQELQYFCLKDKGYHVSVWPRNQNFGDYIDFFIAGISYRDKIDKYIGEYFDYDGRPNYFSDCYINLKEVSPNQNANS